MTEHQPAFPFFVPYVRELNSAERALLQRILSQEAPAMLPQLEGLRVVGRCGCGACPTVFFEEHRPDKPYRDVALYSGRDASGGLVGVALMESHGRLSQLEFYSVDGHERWAVPEPSSIEPTDKGHA